MKEVTLMDSEGKPISTKPATKTKPKKKFEDPPSLRKKIIRKEAPSRKGNPTSASTKSGVSKAPKASIRKAGQSKAKSDHLSKKGNGGVVGALAHLQNDDRCVCVLFMYGGGGGGGVVSFPDALF